MKNNIYQLFKITIWAYTSLIEKYQKFSNTVK